MNKSRRARLNAIINALTELKSDLDTVFDEEDTAMNNMPESMQESDRYCAMEEACDNMSDALDALDEAIDSLESAMV